MLFLMSFATTPEGFGSTESSGAKTADNIHHQPDEIQFEEEMVYSEPAEVMFGAIVTSAVDGSGRVFMGDNDQKMVHVFNPDGSYLDSFGSGGNGPGEFQMMNKIAVDENHVHVFDLIMGRINLFELSSLNFVRAITLSENGGRIRRGAEENPGLGRPFDFHLLPDGNYLVSYRSLMNINRPRTAIVSPGGEILEEDRFEFRASEDEFTENSSGNRRVFATFPFSRTTGLTVSANGLLFSNWSESLEFDLYDASGNQLRTFSYPYQNVEMNRQELLNMYENMQPQGIVMGGQGGSGGGGFPPIVERLKDMELPETWPAVDEIYADTQNRLWVSSFTERADERKWHLFDDSGDLIGTFTWPASRRVVHAAGQTVYVLDRPMDDLDKVIRYRFE